MRAIHEAGFVRCQKQGGAGDFATDNCAGTGHSGRQAFDANGDLAIKLIAPIHQHREQSPVEIIASPDASEVHTSKLPQASTVPEINRPTGPTTVLPPPSAATTKPKLRRSGIAIVVIAVAVIVAITAMLVNSYLSGKREQTIESIAVMPFTDMSAARDHEFFCEGMS